MSFILKNNPTVINIKLTNLGRQLLSQGKLTMTKWAVGDSEIDYSYNTDIEFLNPSIGGFSAFNANILRPKDNNPKFTSYILKDNDDQTTTHTSLPTVVSNTNIITNTATSRGFFNINGDNVSLLSDTLRMKQGDMRVQLLEVTGGTTLNIKKSPSYLSNPVEPVIGDYILVKWVNPIVTGDSVNFTIDKNKPLPYLWYKIENIISGSLGGDDLKVTVDRPLPHFNLQGSGKYSPAFLYPNNNNRTISGDSIQTYYSAPYTTDFIEESVIAFLENGVVPLRDVPVWNMAIVFREDVAGLTSTSRNYSQFYSKYYGGFIKYIQQLDTTINKIGIIHFSNASPSNLYGEGFFADTPVLDLPTIMWHYETGNTIGLKLTCGGNQKILPNLETPYYDLVDKFGHVLGKAFIDLKVFVIEDQELLFVMSYKSNRNWTLPKPVIGLNLSLCDPCVLAIDTVIVDTTDGLNNGSITINASNVLGTILYSIDDGVTYVTTNTFTGLGGGNYSIKVVDSGGGNCIATAAVTVADSVAPTTIAPTTAAPTTVAPTTVAPTTAAPTTAAPTTAAPPPTTVAPTTAAPTTAAPTTAAPVNLELNLWALANNTVWRAGFTNNITSNPLEANVGLVGFDSDTGTLPFTETNSFSVVIYKVNNGGIVEDSGEVVIYLNGVSVYSQLIYGGNDISFANNISFNFAGVVAGDTLTVEAFEGFA